MRRRLIFMALAVLVGGCKSMSHPVEALEKEKAPEFASQAPNGERSPFGN